ncbi:hypothetical protein [Pedobacter sp. L105]|nr:hypothetical protein [Pedobacter sp. L105]
MNSNIPDLSAQFLKGDIFSQNSYNKTANNNNKPAKTKLQYWLIQ